MLLLVSMTATAPAQALAAGAAAVAPTQQLATLIRAHQAFAQPDRQSAKLVVVPAHRPITGAHTTLPVLGTATAADAVTWLRVRLPGRPNGRTGWITQANTARSSTDWHLVVENARRQVVIYRAGKRVRAVPAVVGKPSTPTPLGEFFVEEDVQLRPSDAGAPYAIALSARSTVLQEFDGGPGQIALHGRSNLGGVLGTAASHGCVRLTDATMRWFVLHIGPGAPVSIRR
ncbi:MAG: L,D-transpeptidase [Acidobacteria bacterium]|nr:L,D-transpeptidase [Acidobacteriota bacterium]